MEISRSELQYLLDLQLKKYIDQLQPTIAIVVEDTLNSLGIAPVKWISQAAAYREYGRITVKRWIEQGWLPVYSDGNGKRKRILRVDLDRCAARNNRQRYGKGKNDN